MALKLDRLTRSVLDCANDDINTTNQTNSNLRDTNSIDVI